jgi:hypothetical protein
MEEIMCIWIWLDDFGRRRMSGFQVRAVRWNGGETQLGSYLEDPGQLLGGESRASK